MGDFGLEFDGSHVSVWVWVWAKFSGFTSMGWSDWDDVIVVADADPASSTEPSASAGAMFRGSTIGG